MPCKYTSIYLGPLFVFWLILFTTISKYNIGHLYSEYWKSTVTMAFGSFVAGSTPLGGGAVAFPVFTKLMNINATDASTFSLLIQSVGMSFATLFFISRKIKIDWVLIKYASIGSFLSLPLCLVYIKLNNTDVRFIFTEFIIVCGFILLWKKKESIIVKDISIFLAIIFGIVGGILTAKIGSGCDIILFFYLIFIRHQPVKNSIPTTVSYMAINSIYASIFLLSTTNLSDFVIGSWMTSAPVVSLGAPLGAYVLSKLSSFHTNFLVIVFICIEVVSSYIFIPFSLTSRIAIILTITLLLSFTIFSKYTLLNSKKN